MFLIATIKTAFFSHGQSSNWLQKKKKKSMYQLWKKRIICKERNFSPLSFILNVILCSFLNWNYLKKKRWKKQLKVFFFCSWYYMEHKTNIGKLKWNKTKNNKHFFLLFFFLSAKNFLFFFVLVFFLFSLQCFLFSSIRKIGVGKKR